MGTPEFAVPSLVALADSGKNIIAVVTQPDRPKGRKQILTPSPVKERAEKLSFPIYQPEKVRDPRFIETIKTLSPDVMVVVAFGQILPQTLLDVPRFGCVNVHASLLPKFRGAAPVHWALIEGERETGVTTMLLDAGMDTGPMLRKKSLTILPQETGVTLSQKLSHLGATVLLETLEDLEKGKLHPIPQDPKLATYAPLLKKMDGEVVWEESAVRIERKWRALTLWPGMFTYHRKGLIKLVTVRVSQEIIRAQPGEVLDAGKEAIIVATGQGSLEILELQPENGRKMTVSQYLSGHPLMRGERLGEK
ncbi:MAG: methionyl-tRNA formyltransferase [Nitrospirae bacterium]|nr:methionyl-tRNA formyltransferase [Nitrospirota bacterium]